MSTAQAIFKVEKRSILVEQVSDRIRDAIKSGRLKPGDRLIETDLANSMKIGRNAVREAIRYLEKEGLITCTPFKGARIAELTAKDLEDLHDLRMVLEELAIRTLVKKLDGEKMARLRTITDRMKRVAKSGTVQEAVDIDLTFHQTICELSGNHHLLGAWINLSNQLRAFLTYEGHLYDNDTPEAILEMHYPVLDAIFAEDAELAAKRMRDIITRGYLLASKRFELSQDEHAREASE